MKHGIFANSDLLSFGLLDYLWGIETNLLFQFFDVLDELLDYLWGIETLDLYLKWFCIDALLDYLWGIETALQILLVFEQIRY